MRKITRYSKKRDAIYELLASTTCHPSAEWIYRNLKAEYPDLSLGTVYRNLSRFKEDGSIISVGVVDGQERYDGNANRIRTLSAGIAARSSTCTSQ
jgi:Fur family peroxide stress response transcriptional regulator